MNRYSIATSLQRQIQGKVSVPDGPISDYSRLNVCRPILLVQSPFASDFSATCDFARKHGLRVSIRGRGHSSNGKSLSDGIIFEFQSASQYSLLDDNHVLTHGGCGWLELETYLNNLEKTFPVLTDFLDLSVGGTLVAGGYGVRSICHGRQVDHVVEFKLYTPVDTIVCSKFSNPNLFKHTLSAINSMGLVSDVVLSTIKWEPRIRLLTFRINGLSELADFIKWACVSFGDAMLQFDVTRFNKNSIVTARLGIRPGTFINHRLKDYVLLEDTVYSSYHLSNHAQVKAWKNTFTQDYRIWCDFLIPAVSLTEFLAFSKAIVNESEKHLVCFYVLAVRASDTLDESTIYFCESSANRFLIGFYYMVPTQESNTRTEIKRLMRTVLEKCLQLGGTPYLQGHHCVDKNVLGSVAAKHLDSLSVKKTVDPDNLLI